MTRMERSILVIAVALVASSSPAEDRTVSRFRIEVNVTPMELQMRCADGCVWETLNVGCEGREPCSFVLDEHGMGDSKRER